MSVTVPTQAEFDSLASRVSSVETKVSGLEPRVATLESKVASLEARVTKLEQGTTTPPPTTTRRLFAPTSFYNTKLSVSTPLHSNSAGMIKEILRQAVPQNTNSALPKFNSMAPVYDTPTYDPAIPYYGNVNSTGYTSAAYIITDPATKKQPIIIRQNNADCTWLGAMYERLKAGMRVPANPTINAGTDGHICFWDQIDDVYYEFWQFKAYGTGQWQASFGGIIDNVSNADGIVPDVLTTWGSMSPTGATATSLPLIGGMIKAAEMKAGVIPHCIGFAIPEGPNKFKWPARRTDGGVQFWEGPNAIQAGQRFKFPADIYIDPNWIPLVKMMVVAIRDYGCVVQDRAGAICYYAENTAQYGITDSTAEYRKKADGTSLQGWQFMNPNYFPFAKLQALA